MQTFDDKERFFFIQLDLIASSRVCEWSVEPFLERLDRIEDLGKDEVQQGPQFGKIVLQRSSGQN